MKSYIPGDDTYQHEPDDRSRIIFYCPQRTARQRNNYQDATSYMMHEKIHQPGATPLPQPGAPHLHI